MYICEAAADNLFDLGRAYAVSALRQRVLVANPPRGTVRLPLYAGVEYDLSQADADAVRARWRAMGAAAFFDSLSPQEADRQRARPKLAVGDPASRWPALVDMAEILRLDSAKATVGLFGHVCLEQLVATAARRAPQGTPTEDGEGVVVERLTTMAEQLKLTLNAALCGNGGVGRTEVERLTDAERPDGARPYAVQQPTTRWTMRGLRLRESQLAREFYLASAALLCVEERQSVATLVAGNAAAMMAITVAGKSGAFVSRFRVNADRRAQGVFWLDRASLDAHHKAALALGIGALHGVRAYACELTLCGVRSAGWALGCADCGDDTGGARLARSAWQDRRRAALGALLLYASRVHGGVRPFAHCADGGVRCARMCSHVGR